MGWLFELTADTAPESLNAYNTACHVCDKGERDLYKYQGSLEREDGTTNEDIYAICATCILAKKLRHTCNFEYICTLEKHLATSGLGAQEAQIKKEKLVAKYQRTPNVPLFMQQEDRPLCCNDITEFRGYPKDANALYALTEKSNYWELELAGKNELYNFRVTGLPETFEDIASFKCRHCGKDYFTFQFT